jgi:ribosomal-protein-alanine N-acetyltransferase
MTASQTSRDEIRTSRLLLRRASWDDLDDIHQVMSSQAAMRYWSRLPHASPDVTREWFPSALLDVDNPAMDEWVLEFEARAIGYMGIWKMPEFGFILNPEVWGRGLATEAAEAVIPYLFGRHDLAALTADVGPRNSASLRLLKKLGFAETGFARRTFLLGDEWCDSIFLALPRPAFRRATAPDTSTDEAIK